MSTKRGENVLRSFLPRGHDIPATEVSVRKPLDSIVRIHVCCSEGFRLDEKPRRIRLIDKIKT